MTSEKFKIKKEISLPHILTFLSVLGGIVLWYGDLASRIAVAETRIVNIEYNGNKTDARLTRIENKIDRIIENLVK